MDSSSTEEGGVTRPSTVDSRLSLTAPRLIRSRQGPRVQYDEDGNEIPRPPTGKANLVTWREAEVDDNNDNSDFRVLITEVAETDNGHFSRTVRFDSGVDIHDVERLLESQSSSSEISEADTELEVDYEEYLEEAHKYDHTGTAEYIRVCNEVGVIPVTYFMRHIQDSAFVMRFHGLGPLGAKAIAKPLQNNSTIDALDLKGNDIDQGVVYIARALRDNVFITKLILSENNIGHVGAKTICKMLHENRYLTKVDLSGNGLKDTDGIYFLHMLEDNKTLQELLLSHNQFEIKSAVCFREALSTNETLRHLDLSWNYFREDSGKEIAEGIKENFGLRTLNFAMNGLGLEGSAAMGVALCHNRTLWVLDISANRIPKEAAPHIQKGLEVNDCLRKLMIGRNPLTEDGALAILKGVDKSECSHMKYLDFMDIRVTKEFEYIENNVKLKHPDIEIIHGGVMSLLVETVLVIKESFVDAYNKDPMTLLKNFVEKSGLRMIDFFKQIDKEGKQTLSREEFIKGVKSCGIDMTDRQLRELAARVDSDNDGMIGYGELILENTEHRSVKRKVKKSEIINDQKEDEVKENPMARTFTIKGKLDKLKELDLG